MKYTKNKFQVYFDGVQCGSGEYVVYFNLRSVDGSLVTAQIYINGIHTSVNHSSSSTIDCQYSEKIFAEKGSTISIESEPKDQSIISELIIRKI